MTRGLWARGKPWESSSPKVFLPLYRSFDWIGVFEGSLRNHFDAWQTQWTKIYVSSPEVKFDVKKQWGRDAEVYDFLTPVDTESAIRDVAGEARL